MPGCSFISTLGSVYYLLEYHSLRYGLCGSCKSSRMPTADLIEPNLNLLILGPIFQLQLSWQVCESMKKLPFFSGWSTFFPKKHSIVLFKLSHLPHNRTNECNWRLVSLLWKSWVILSFQLRWSCLTTAWSPISYGGTLHNWQSLTWYDNTAASKPNVRALRLCNLHKAWVKAKRWNKCWSPR